MPDAAQPLTHVPHTFYLPETAAAETVEIRKNERQQWTVPVFRDAAGRRCFRFAAPAAGVYRYQTADLDSKFSVRLYKGDNPLYARGPVRLSEDGRHFVYGDGSPFFYLADTWWYALTPRTDLGTLDTLIADRLAKGFTAVQIVVGLPPEDAGTPAETLWRADGGIDPHYFDVIDRKIDRIVDAGLVPCLFGGWGDHMDRYGLEPMKTLWAEIVARYASYPALFCLSGEVDMPAPRRGAVAALTALPKRIVRKLFPPHVALRIAEHAGGMGNLSEAVDHRLKKWAKVGRFIKAIDPFDRPLTAHTVSTVTACERFPDQKWLDFDGFQSGHVRFGDRQGAVAMVAAHLRRRDGLTINLEPWYEGIRGHFHAVDQRYALWMCLLSGARGHAYGAHGLWQMSTPGENFQGHWGPSDWQTAYRAPGGAQVGATVRWLCARFDWLTLEPCRGIIAPHFESHRPYFPLAAATRDGRYLVYFPAGGKRRTYVTDLIPTLRAAWIDPITLETEATFACKPGDALEVDATRRDWLLLLEPPQDGAAEI
jgi:hypothetical protein